MDSLRDSITPWISTLATVLVAGCGLQISEDCSNPENAGWCNGPTSESESGTGGECTQVFDEQPTGSAITITLRNDAAVAVYVPWSVVDCTWEPMTLWMGSERLFWSGAYAPTCTELLATGCGYGCSDGPTSVLKLDPGASYDFEWDGFVQAPLQLDAECVETAGCVAGDMCWTGRQLDADLVQFRLGVTQDCVDGVCDCGSSACLITADSLTVGGLWSTTTDWTLDLAHTDGDVVWAIGG